MTSQDHVQGYPLSAQQRRLWQLQGSDGGSRYRVSAAVGIEGRLEAGAVAAALAALVERYEILRTTFRSIPGLDLPLQVVAPTLEPVFWHHDLSACSAAERAAALARLAGEMASLPFAPAEGPVVRAALVTLDAAHHQLLLDLPALCADAATVDALAAELAASASLGGAAPPGAAAAPVQYADIAAWQEEILESADGQEGRRFWKSRLALAAAPAAARPAWDEEAEVPEGGFAPQVLEVALPPDLSAAAAAAAAAAAVAGPGRTAAVLLAAWNLLLQRLFSTAPVLGVACGGRGYDELRGACGPLTRYLPLALEAPETEPFLALVEQAAMGVSELERWQEYFDGSETAPAPPPHFPFCFEAVELPARYTSGEVVLAVERLAACGDRFALKLSCLRRGDELSVALHYDGSAWSRAQVERVAGWWLALLGAAVSAPRRPLGAFELLTPDEGRWLDERNRTRAEHAPPETLDGLFAAQAARTPDAVALEAGGVTLTYGELRREAGVLAAELRRRGVGPEVRVGLAVERSPEMVVGMLGILAAGGAYVPLDPEYPLERQRFSLEDSGAVVLVTSEDLAGRLPAPPGGVVCLELTGAPRIGGEEPAAPGGLPEHLAYVIYTSGSTGRPKGVTMTHRAIANRLSWMQRVFPLAPADRVLQKTPYSFDASIWEIFCPLLAGARVVLAAPGAQRDPALLLEEIAAHEVTVLQLVPSQLPGLLAEPDAVRACTGLHRLFCGGEALPAAVARDAVERLGVELHNLYGPTEAAIDATCRPHAGDGTAGVVAIGRPLDNVEVHVADRHLRRVPPGLPGELLIGGRGLARGYMARPELTAERFVPSPWSELPGERLYRSGDLVRWAAAGELEYLGRLDHQVKIRGFRVELGEIEAALLRHPQVREAAVVVREESAGDPRLVAYVAAAATGGDRRLHRLPNGLEVAYLNRNETDAVYRETFAEQRYLAHGIQLHDEACVVDAGANIGLFSLWVKSQAPRSRIYAFEPIPPIFEVLRANMALYGLDVELFPSGLMDRAGTVRFSFYPRWSAMSSAYADQGEDEAVTRQILAGDPALAREADGLLAGRFQTETFDCPVTTLSQVIRERGIERIDLLKIDVEKAELDVLRGLAEEDWSRICQVVVEVHDRDGRVAQLQGLLEHHGFSVAVDQDPLLAGTGMYELHAVHPRRQVRQVRPSGRPAAPEHPLALRAGLSAPELRDYLAERLPQQMVPQVFVLLPALPRLPNGKLDRRGLPEPGSVAAAPAASFVAPRTPLEEILGGMWAEVLRVERVGVDDDFFDLGGHSLLATQLVARVRESLRLDVKIRTLFGAPTLGGFAAAVAAAQRGLDEPPAPALGRRPRGGELPLSFAQQRLWFLEQLEGGGAVYNLPTALLLSGRLDVGALHAALDEIVRRHEALRTHLPSVDGRPVQVVSAPAATALPVVDLRRLATGERERELRRVAAEITLRPFDLARGPLLRAALAALADGRHAALFSLHHTISDGWSAGIFVDELAALYAAFTAGRPSPLAAPAIQFADYALWQRDWLSGSVLAAQLAYWRTQLAGLPPQLDLPADHPRPAAQDFAGARLAFVLPDGLTRALLALGSSQGATLFMVLLGAFQALLSRYSGQEDVAVGTPIANRERALTERLIGCLANTLVLRTDLSGNPGFDVLLARVRETALQAYAHQDVPFEMLVDELRPERDLSRTPLFQVLFSLLAARQRLQLPGIEIQPLSYDTRTARFDLSCDLFQTGGTLTGSLEYSTSLFEPPTVERLAGHWRALLAGIAASPAGRPLELPILAAAEVQQVLVEWNATAAVYARGRTVPELFEEQAARTPSAVALAGGEPLSYGELDHRAGRLADQLAALGVRPDEPVGICLERSPEMVVALLAVLKAGAAYLPLDPGYPAARLAFMADDAGARYVLTQERLLAGLPAFRATAIAIDVGGAGDDDPAPRAVRRQPARATPENLAYVIYTSGSTGTPKGVMVSHRNVVSFFAGMDAALGGGPAGTWLAVTSISFDISVLELLWTLTRGFRVVLQRGPEVLAAPSAALPWRPIDFSLFYFAKSEGGSGADRYRLLLEGARFADRHGFAAVWTPERHFHDFGGLYPNPAVTSAAIATITERVRIRAGSVVLPLHEPIRVAEEWAMIDNLSHGRVGISFASGWHADDFALAPDRFARRKEVMLEGIATVRRLWRGEAVRVRGGAGNEIELRTLPRPIQPELPVWVTAAGNVETFRQAGELGAGVLTHLLGQDLEELARKVAAYRQSWREHGHGPGGGHVALMLHAFVGEDYDAVRETVRKPFCDYLRSSLDLVRNLGRSLGREVDPKLLSAQELDDLLELSFERYFDTSALLGTPETCLALVERLKQIGIDEVACLIDFGVEVEAVLASLRHLDTLRQLANRRPEAPAASGPAVAEQLESAGITHFQCTPTMARVLAADPSARRALGGLDHLLLGGEALPAALVEQLQEAPPAALHNMYGPTETTVWSATWRVPGAAARIAIGQPIANTAIHIADRRLQPLPAGVPGELLIGGDGVTRGYLGRPELTAERFVPDPFGTLPGGRLYRTGDLARRRPDGEIDFLGRLDQQVKVRGHRIELAEIERALERHPAIAQAAVALQEVEELQERDGGLSNQRTQRTQRLVAYFVLAGEAAAAPPWSGRYHHLPNGLRVACMNDFQAGQAYREVFAIEIYLRHGITLADGDCVFDVGANIGFFSLFASRRAQDLAIYAFEPIPLTLQALHANVELHGIPAEVLPIGVGERAETAVFSFYPEMPGLSGRYPDGALDRETSRAMILAGLSDQGATLPEEEIEDLLDEQFHSESCVCPVRTLSEVIDERGIEVIDLLKIDVERAELDVLRGVRPEHWRRVRQVAMEIDGKERLDSAVELLRRQGFAVDVDHFLHVPAVDGRVAVDVYMLYARRAGARPPGVRRRTLPPASAAGLRAFLAQSLPEPMLPGAFVQLAALPLTANGKVDRRALSAAVPAAAPEREFAAPRTPVERLLAGLWQDLLRVPRVGRDDSFFELGGDSILSIQLIARAHQLGLHLTPRQLFQHPTIAELAAVVGAGTAAAAAAPEEAVGPVPLTPIQLWFFEQELPAPQHWNHALLLAARRELEPRRLRGALAALLVHHDALRLRFARDASGWSQECVAWDGAVPLLHLDLSALPPAARQAAQAAAVEAVQASLDLTRGPLMRVALLARGDGQPQLLLIVVHHLVVDGLSWRILLEDLGTAYEQLGAPGAAVRLPARTASFRRWAEHLARQAGAPEIAAELPFWRSMLRSAPPALPVDRPGGDNREGAARTVSVWLDGEETRQLLQQVPAVYHTQVNDVLLTAVALGFARWSGHGALLVDVEGHGREEIGGYVDVSRTVGWLTALYPVLLQVDGERHPGKTLMAVKERLRRIPNRGVGHGLLRYGLPGGEAARRLRDLPASQVTFNYLGQFDQVTSGDSPLTVSAEASGTARDPRQPRRHLLDVGGEVAGGRLRLSWTYGQEVFAADSIERLAAACLDELRRTIAHCLSLGAGGFTPSDFPAAGLDQATLDRLAAAHPAVEDMLPLTALQQGLLFHSLEAPDSPLYLLQLACRLRGDLDAATFERSWQRVMERHAILRSGFVWEGLAEPLQVVSRDVRLPCDWEDWRGLDAAGEERRLEALLAEHRRQGLAIDQAPLMRITVARTGEREHLLAWTHHHLLVDGWSVLLLVAEVCAQYAALAAGVETRLAPLRPYRDYVLWQRRQSIAEAEQFWRRSLAGITAPTPLGLDRPRHAAPAAEPERASLALSAAATAELRAMARSHHLTLNTLVLGAWAFLLGLVSGEEEVVLGVVSSGREADLPGVETMVGVFINTLPLRIPLSPSLPLSSWLRGIQERQVELRRFEQTPLSEVQRWSEVPRGVPLFESIFVFQSQPAAPAGGLGNGGLEVGDVRSFARTNYPLTLRAEAGEELQLEAVLDRNRFDAAWAGRLVEHLRQLLAAFAAAPERPLGLISLAAAGEPRDRLAAPRPQAAAPRQCLHELFEERAAAAPAAIAITCEGEELSYGQLDADANALARHLVGLGVQPGEVVGLCVERSPAMVAGIIGILKAGAAYLPLDPAQPRERLAFMLADAGVRIVLTQDRLRAVLPDSAVRAVCLDTGWPEIERAAGGRDLLRARTAAESLAYVIYTSGSTGRPKGVLVTHANVVRLFTASRDLFGFGPDDVWSLFHSFAFDFAVWELWGALLFGGRAVVVPYWVARAPEELLRLLAAERVTVLNQVPSAFHRLPQAEQAEEESPPRQLALRWVIFGGEALSPEALAGWFARHGDRHPRLVNMYGITETTVHVTWRELGAADAADGGSPIGAPLPDLSLDVLSRWMQPVPEGVAGELYVGGPGLAIGYLGRPDLSAERFVPDPWGRHAGARLYRTGDLARRTAAGELEYLGRSDHQIKLRGYRIEPGEIESTLRRHPAVSEVAVVADPAPLPGAAARLVAYVVPRQGHTAEAGELRAWLSLQLPEPMVPEAYVLIDALPRTAGGKLDRRALPAPQGSLPAGAGPGAGAALRTAAEEMIAGIWAEVLQRAEIGPHDNFLALGGHSLLATQVVSRIRQAFRVDLPLRSLFEKPTVAELALEITALRQAQGGAEPPPPLVRAGHHQDPPPLSFAQQRLWFLQRLGMAGPAYHVATDLRIAGRLDVAALRRSLSEVVRRHESLRTAFPEDRPVQLILPPRPVALPAVDLGALPPACREAEARRLAVAEVRRRFDLARDPLLRGALLRLAPDEHVLLLTMHHIASDGWSAGILVHEMSLLYPALARGESPALPELPIQYADYARWQRGWLQGAVLDRELAYWRHRLAGAPPAIELATDRPRPAVATFAGGLVQRQLGREPAAALAALARRRQVTLFMVLLAAFQALLGRRGGQRDLSIGTPVAGRNRIETEGLIGFLVNTLVLRGDLGGNPSFAALLERSRDTVLDAQMHQDLPFEQVVEALRPERDLSRTPLFQVMLALRTVAATVELPGLGFQPFGVHAGATKFDLTLEVVELPALLSLSAEYATDLFDAGSIARLLDSLVVVLEAVAADETLRLADLPLLSAAQRHQLLVEWGSPEAIAGAGAPLHELFALQVERRPEAEAVACGGHRFSYRELDRRANQLANCLRKLGVGPEVRVGLCTERSLDLVVGILGILKAGATYVPLDPAYPMERLAFIVADSRTPVVVTEEALAARFPAGGPRLMRLDADAELIARESTEAPASGVPVDGGAYVIYTSGSTGTPKGVTVTHRNVSRLFAATERWFHFDAADVWTLFHSFAFDFSVWELWGALLHGGRLVVVPHHLSRAPEDFYDLLRQERVTVLNQTPSAFRQLIQAEAARLAKPAAGPHGLALRLVIFGGEALAPQSLRPWLLRHGDERPRLINMYGITETTIHVTFRQVGWNDLAAAAAPSMIGVAIPDLAVYVLDAAGNPVPPGAPGELYVGGAGLARGYLGRPDLTAERFVPHPFSRAGGARLYRSGDLGRYRAGRHDLEYLGRADDQVKVRGFRIEPGEIETALASIPGVRQGVVLLREDDSGEPRLAAYVVPAGPEPPSVAQLRGALLERLPEHMVPALFTFLDVLPLTDHGKVDRRALSTAAAPPPPAPGEDYAAPRTPIEELLAGVWASVLGVARVGIDDNFFALGGDSMRTLRVLTAVRERGFDFELQEIYRHQTVRELAQAVGAALGLAGAPPGGEAGPAAPPPAAAELDALLAEIEQLSADEVRSGLQEELTRRRVVPE